MSISQTQFFRVAARHDLGSDRGRVEYCAEIGEMIAAIPNEVEQEIYINRAAKTANITSEAMRRVVNEKRRPPMMLCPIMGHIAHPSGEVKSASCLGDRCAWWRIDCCALVEIARNSADIQAVSDSIDGLGEEVRNK